MPRGCGPTSSCTRGLIHSQRVLLALTEAGLGRQEAYAIVQRHAMRAWQDGMPLLELLRADPEVTARLDEAALAALFDLGYHTRHVDRIFARVFGAAAGAEPARARARSSILRMRASACSRRLRLGWRRRGRGRGPDRGEEGRASRCGWWSTGASSGCCCGAGGLERAGRSRRRPGLSAAAGRPGRRAHARFRPGHDEPAPYRVERFGPGPMVAGNGSTYHVLFDQERVCAEAMLSGWMARSSIRRCARSRCSSRRAGPPPGDACAAIPFTTYAAAGWPLLTGKIDRPSFVTTAIRFDYQPGAGRAGAAGGHARGADRGAGGLDRVAAVLSATSGTASRPARWSTESGALGGRGLT